MSFVIPVFRPVRCGPVARVTRRSDFATPFRLFDETLSELSRASQQVRRPTFAPRFNVSEGYDYYSLEGELPGVDQKDVSVEFTDENTLTIRGRVEKHEEKGKAPANEPAVQGPQQSESAARTETPVDEASSTKSYQATVEDEKEWTEVGTPASSETGPSATTAQKDEGSSEAAAFQTKAAIPENRQQCQSRSWISERFTGEFSRTFSFADRVDQEAVKASLNNGILSIVVPKAAKPENRKITVE